METIKAIFTRRSIRKYTDKKVSKKIIDLMLKSAMYAPSARNYQPWHFIVVKDKSILKSITKVHPHAQMLNDAAVAILVCGDKSIEPSEEYLNQNCAAATQNILLAAHAKKLGAVWLGVYPREERMKGIIELFNLPENILPVSLISIGYPAEEKEMPDRYKADRIRINKW